MSSNSSLSNIPHPFKTGGGFNFEFLFEFILFIVLFLVKLIKKL